MLQTPTVLPRTPETLEQLLQYFEKANVLVVSRRDLPSGVCVVLSEEIAGQRFCIIVTGKQE